VQIREAMIQDTFYASRAPTANRDFVLLPGLGLSGRYLKALATQLSQDANVWIAEWRPDLNPGEERPCSVGGAAEEVSAWMCARSLKSAVLAGHSFGAQIASVLAARAASLVDRLVLIAPSVDPAARTLWKQIGRLVRDAPSEPVKLLLLAGIEYLRNWRRIRKMARAALNDPVERWLPEIRAPVLVIRGTKDPVVPAEWTLRVVFLLHTSKHCTIAGAAHGVPFSAARLVADAIRRFAVSAMVDASAEV
jgi:2-hydroxy-6-oxonona-2,4-dienedioate hydrolase